MDSPTTVDLDPPPLARYAYTLTADDREAAMREALPSRRYWITSALVLLVLYIFAMWLLGRERIETLFLGLLLIPILTVAASDYSRRTVSSAPRGEGAPPEKSRVLDSHAISRTADSLIFETPQGDDELSWHDLSHWQDGPSFVLVFTPTERFYAVPKRLESPGFQQLKLVETLKSHVR